MTAITAVIFFEHLQKNDVNTKIVDKTSNSNQKKRQKPKNYEKVKSNK